MVALRFLAALLFIVAVPTALVTSTIRYVANEPRVYLYAIDEYDAVQATNIERQELIRAGAELRAYFNNSAEQVDIRVVQEGRDIPLYNSREVQHLEDVKDRFLTMNKAQEFSVVYVLAYIAVVVLWAREISVRRLAAQTAIASLLTLVVIGGLGAFSMSGFDSAWRDFHELMFSNDFWLLNPRTDRLIQIFPPAFWESIVFFIGILTAAEAGLLLIASGIYLGVTHRETAPAALAPSYG